MALSGAAVLLLGFLSGQTGSPDTAWYRSLTLPAWQPPGAAFGIVWTALYLLIGAAAALVWTSVHPFRRFALLLFAVQLALNLAWTPVFFRLGLIGPALALLGAIWVLALVTALAFAQVRRRAGWMLVPYMVWLSYAFVLNLRIWQLNG